LHVSRFRLKPTDASADQDIDLPVSKPNVTLGKHQKKKWYIFMLKDELKASLSLNSLFWDCIMSERQRHSNLSQNDLCHGMPGYILVFLGLT
jgi:hypothetical protein